MACTEAPEPKAEIRIGMLLSRSGESARFGQTTVEGVELAVQQINDAGGLVVGGHPHKVVLIVEDFPVAPEAAMQAARRLINQENVTALVGPLMSTTAIPVATLAEQTQIPMITPSATNPAVTHGKRFVFRVAFVDDFQGRVIARFAYEELTARTAAVLYDVADPYSRDLATVFKQIFEEAGGRVVVFEPYTTGEQDFRPPLARIREAAPEVLFLPNYSNATRAQGRQAAAMGITATLLGSDRWNQTMYAGLPVFEGAYYTHHWHPDIANEQGRAFIEAYRAAYGTMPGIGGAVSYDALGLLCQAIENAGSLDGEPIRDALARLNGYRGVTGTISYQGRGDPVKSAVIMQIKDGQAVFHKIVEP